MRFLLNGTTQIAKILVPAVNGDATGLALSTDYALAVGDYVVMQAYQNSGGNLDVSRIADYSPEFMMRLTTGF